MKKINRVKIVKAMDLIARLVNDERVFDYWMMVGVADGDVEFGDLNVTKEDVENLEYYIRDNNFSYLMAKFLYLMESAGHGGGLSYDSVLSKSKRVEVKRYGIIKK